MANVTLSADTLWSSIAGTVDTDGDQVDLNGFTLTIDKSVVPAVSWRNTKKGGRLECINTSTTDVIVINCYDRFKFYFFADAEVNFSGTMIDAASGFDGTSGQVLDSLVQSYSGPIKGVWLKNAGMWLHNHDKYAASTPVVAGYDDEFLEFSYDSSTKQFTTSHYIPDTAEVFQIPNIVVTNLNFTETIPQIRYWNITNFTVENVAFWDLGGQYYSGGSTPNISFKRVHLGAYGEVTAQSDMFFDEIGCMGDFDTESTANGTIHLSNSWMYSTFTSNNYNVDWDISNTHFQSSYGQAISFRHGSKLTDCTVKWAALNNADELELINLTLIDDYDTTQYNPTGLGGSRRVYKNMKRPYVSSRLLSASSSYATYDCRFVDLYLDYINEISGSVYIDLWPFIDTRFINWTILLPSGTTNSFTTQGGYNEIIGMYAPQTTLSNSAFSLFGLDVTHGNNGAVSAGDMNTLLYNNDAVLGDGWHILFNYNGGDPFVVEKSAGIYIDTGWWYGVAGDYMIVDLTNDYWFIDEVGSFTGFDKARAAVTTYYSYDEGTTWMTETELTSSTPPSPLKLWMKIEWTSDTDRFDYIKIYYDRAAGFTGYPSYYYDVYCRLNFLPTTESMNVRWNVAGRVKEETSGLSDTMQLRVLYRDAVETGYATVRKYGWTFEKPAFQVQKGSSTIENTVDGYFLGAQKTDLTLTEAEAAAITGVVLQSSADVEYTWELDCGGGSVENAYHYTQYMLTNFGEWAGVNTFELDEFLIRDGDKFKTVQAQAGEGVKLVNYTGKVSGMTKDDGSVYVPPVDVIMTIDNIVVGSSVYIHTTDDNTEIFLGTADTSTVSATISGLNGKPYEVVIRKASSDPRYVEWTATGTIGTVDISITANQQEM